MKKVIDVLENIDNELREVQGALTLRSKSRSGTNRIAVRVEHYKGMLRAASMIISDVAAAERGGWIE